jgi:protein SCO1/2
VLYLDSHIKLTRAALPHQFGVCLFEIYWTFPLNAPICLLRLTERVSLTMRDFTRATLRLVLTSALALPLLACGPSSNDGNIAQSGTVIASGTAAIGGDFTLTDETGATFTQDNLIGQPNLIYFGFSYCPDVCPTALQKMGALQANLGDDGDKLKYIFISVDTERDTPETLAPYVTSRGFPNPLIGLSGTQAQIDEAVSAYRVYAQKVNAPESAAEFTYDHSDLIILMNSKGEFEDIFTRDSSLPQMVGRVRLLLNKEG